MRWRERFSTVLFMGEDARGQHFVQLFLEILCGWEEGTVKAEGLTWMIKESGER